MDKPKFNLLDGFLIVLILLIVLAGALILMRPQSTPADTTRTATAEYSIEFAKYDKSVADAFVAAKEAGETVWVSEKERFPAAITDVSITPAKTVTVDERRNRAVLGEDPSCYDITITLESTVTETNDAITASGNRLMVGEKISARSKSAAGNGYIVSLKLKD